jgi:hypothetical protein
MGLPRKGARAITVDGRRYRWVATYSPVIGCSAACPLRLTVQRDGGRGQLLVANFDGEAVIDGRTWMFPRYGAEVTPGVVGDVIRAGLAAGWEPEASRRPPVVLDGEPFLRLPEDPSQPPPGSEDYLKRQFLAALREQLLAALSPSPPADAGQAREPTTTGGGPPPGQDPEPGVNPASP